MVAKVVMAKVMTRYREWCVPSRLSSLREGQCESLVSSSKDLQWWLR
jgi:hypothetical protein